MREKRIFCAILILLALSVLLAGCTGPAPPQQNQTNAVPSSQTPPAQQNATIPAAAGCGNLEVYVLNVSQADSIFIRTPGNRTILIDAGSGMKPNSSSNALAFLKRMNVTKIDYLIASHLHEDHIGGMDKIFTGFGIGTVYDNGNCANLTTQVVKTFLAYAALGTPVSVTTTADIPSDGCLSEAKLIFPYGQSKACSKSNENDNSLLLHLVYGNTSFLFTGDCAGACEAALVSQGSALKSDFLKIAHHGSDTSSSQQFLDAVGAKYYVISTDNERSVKDGYFHPREVTLEKLHALAPTGTFRTDLNGDVKAVSDGSSITVIPSTVSGQCDIFKGYASADASSYSIIPALSGTCG
jgi:competence protein ComEC